MSETMSVELVFGSDIIPVFAENDVYGEIIQNLRTQYREQGAELPIVHLRSDEALAARQYQVVIDGEPVVDERIALITEGTMLEMLTKLSYAFCDQYNARPD
ncbi:MAG: hypothetical protein NC337_08300 [Roseburia sp.]|nr:hypothetical protein [Roseburia sp.]